MEQSVGLHNHRPHGHFPFRLGKQFDGSTEKPTKHRSANMTSVQRSEGRLAVRITTVIGQKWRNSWKRFAGAALTIALLSAVAVVGIALFGSEVLAAWRTPESAGQALFPGGAFAGLLSFEGPAETVARFKSTAEEGQSNIKRADNASLLAKNWKYTAANPAQEQLLATNFALDFFLFLNNNNPESIQEFLEANQPLNFIAASGAMYFAGVFLESLLPGLNPGMRSFVTAYVNGLRSIQAQVNSLIFPANFRPPLIPPVSPSF
jgi:hypothetical protein